MSFQDLKIRYTDGKLNVGALLYKCFTRTEIRNSLFPDLKITSQHCYEKKHAISFWVPKNFRRRFENLIPNNIYTFLWSRFGFLLFTIEKKE